MGAQARGGGAPNSPPLAPHPPPIQRRPSNDVVTNGTNNTFIHFAACVGGGSCWGPRLWLGGSGWLLHPSLARPPPCGRGAHAPCRPLQHGLGDPWLQQRVRQVHDQGRCGGRQQRLVRNDGARAKGGLARARPHPPRHPSGRVRHSAEQLQRAPVRLQSSVRSRSRARACDGDGHNAAAAGHLF